ncbi:MAG TPA: hypothetical protein PKN13_11245 [Accumulibacter sp.]|nr:hypothetical protein [Accumulibacter sp.]HMW16853.1 hypothetical protein [Accumulibacter sp.]HMX21581.1 hypothetical protein [Accumulibacter sp.]HMY06322.1 hypothetical protein [Accumulibacter sp.]HNC17548.1 hypothetical protein [Accumulibacter sp.]
MAGITCVALAKRIPQTSGFSGMQDVERDRAEIFQRQIGDGLLDLEFRGDNRRKIHRHLLFEHCTVILGSNTVIEPFLIDQGNQETRVQQNGGRHWESLRNSSSHSVAFGTSAQAAVPRLTIC